MAADGRRPHGRDHDTRGTFRSPVGLMSVGVDAANGVLHFPGVVVEVDEGARVAAISIRAACGGFGAKSLGAHHVHVDGDSTMWTEVISLQELWSPTCCRSRAWSDPGAR